MLNFDTDNPFIAICAATSRIVQLQSTSYTKHSGVLQPITTKQLNGKYIYIAQKLLESLADRAVSGDTGYISLALICQQLNANHISIDIDASYASIKINSMPEFQFNILKNNASRFNIQIIDNDLESIDGLISGTLKAGLNNND